MMAISPEHWTKVIKYMLGGDINLPPTAILLQLRPRVQVRVLAIRLPQKKMGRIAA